MFNSTNYLLSKIIADIKEEEDSDGLLMTGMAVIKALQTSIDNLKFEIDCDIQLPFLQTDDNETNQRYQAIKTLINTEFYFLQKIGVFLTKIWDIFSKDSKKLTNNLLNKSQIVRLFELFPSIYEMHFALNENFRKDKESMENVGKILFEFLQNPKLLKYYKKYIGNISNYFNLIQTVRTNKNFSSYPELSLMEQTILLPVQKFPQLRMVIGDVYRLTCDNHPDKTFLFRSLCIIKSISLQLDQHRRISETSDFTEVASNLKRLRIAFQSQKLLSKYSVDLLNTTFSIPRRITKEPYFLLLCDNEVIIYPRNIALINMSANSIYVCSLKFIESKFRNISSLRGNNRLNELEKAKELIAILNDPSPGIATLKEIEDFIMDFDKMDKITKLANELRYSYDGIDSVMISKSLLALEYQIYQREKDLNKYLSCILTLVIKNPQLHAKDVKRFQFNSEFFVNNWKLSFYRNKVLMNVKISSEWIFVPSGTKTKPLEIDNQPLLLSNFSLKESSVIDMMCKIGKIQVITILVGINIYRCLWICMENGRIAIIHFDYREWTVLEFFDTSLIGKVSAIAVVTVRDFNIVDIPHDTEIWMSSNDKVFIHSLHDDERSKLKCQLSMPKPIKAMTYMRNRMLVALQPPEIFVYSPTRLSKWLQESTISLTSCTRSEDGSITDIRYVENEHVYIMFQRKIVIMDFDLRGYKVLRSVDFDGNVVSALVVSDGIWTVSESRNEVAYYDKLVYNKLQVIEIPDRFRDLKSVGSLTAILESDKYLWLGTSSGYVICLSMMDVLYFHEMKVPIYFSKKIFYGPVTHLMTFQNIVGTTLKRVAKIAEKRVSLDRRILVRRSLSIPTSDGRRQNHSFEESDSSSVMSSESISENMQATIPKLILAFGIGLGRYDEETDKTDTDDRIKYSDTDNAVLLTFLE